MYQIHVKFTVKDYGLWKQKFEAGAAQREKDGLRTAAVVCAVDDPSKVMVVFQTEDLARGKQHLTDPEIKKKQGDAGFLAPPELFFGKVM